MENSEPAAIIRPEHPASGAAAQLIAELDAYLTPLYPAESRHGYNVEKLIAQKVEFFVLYRGAAPAGCAGAQFFPNPQTPDSAYAELKRMYVRNTYRGRGYAKQLLRHIENLARDRGVILMRLETGIHQPEAVGLYEKSGYYRIGPFGDYGNDPLSLFYEKRLSVGG